MADENNALSPEEVIKREKELLGIQRERAKVEREINDARLEGRQADAGLIQSREELIQKEDKLNDTLSDSTEAINDQTEAIDKAKAAMMGMAAVIPGFVKGIDSAYGTGFSRLTDGIGSAAAAVLEFNNEIQSIEVGLRRSTGFQNRYVRSFGKLRNAYNRIGLTQDVLEKNLLALNKNFAAFDSLSETNRNNITMLVGQFEQLGLSGEMSAQVIDQIHFSFGLMGSSGTAAFKDLRELSKETGLGLEVLAEGITSMGGDLARFGSDAPRVFSELQKRARSLGMTVKDAFDITEQLDTFQGAAEITGRMNAQFGMQLNSVELMRASHEERVDILKQEFALQGKTFQNLDRRQKQMVASIFGRDVGTVARFFGEGMDLARFQEDVGRDDDLNRFIKLEERTKSAEQAVFDSLKKSAEKQLKAMGYGNDLNEAQLKMFAYIAENAGEVGTGLFGLGALKTAGSAAAAAGSGILNIVGTGLMLRGLGAGGLLRGLVSGVGGVKGRGLRAIFGKVLGRGATTAATAATATAAKAAPAILTPAAAKTAGHVMTKSGLLVPAHLAQTAAKAAPAVADDVAKVGLKAVAGKGLAKAGGKLLPGLGLGLALMDATSRVGRGDFLGAGIDVLSGAASLVPGVGTAVSLGLLGTNIARDASRMSAQPPAQATAVSPGGSGDRMEFSDGSVLPIRVVIDELVVHSKLTFNNQTLAAAMDKVMRAER